MKIGRAEFIEGFKLLGFIGLLVGVFVIPGQWDSGPVRLEAAIGVLVSTAFVLAAALLAFSIKPVITVVAQLLFVAGAAYLALVPFIAAEAGWYQWQRISLLALLSAAAALIGWYGLWRLKRHGAQPGVQADVP